jgi:hypothetical protein
MDIVCLLTQTGSLSMLETQIHKDEICPLNSYHAPNDSRYQKQVRFRMIQVKL